MCVGGVSGGLDNSRKQFKQKSDTWFKGISLGGKLGTCPVFRMWYRDTQLALSCHYSVEIFWHRDCHCSVEKFLTLGHTTRSVLSLFYRDIFDIGTHNLLRLVIVPQRVPCPRGTQPSECGLSHFGACAAKNGEQPHTFLFWGGTGNVVRMLTHLAPDQPPLPFRYKIPCKGK